MKLQRTRHQFSQALEALHNPQISNFHAGFKGKRFFSIALAGVEKVSDRRLIHPSDLEPLMIGVDTKFRGDRWLPAMMIRNRNLHLYMKTNHSIK